MNREHIDKAFFLLHITRYTTTTRSPWKVIVARNCCMLQSTLIVKTMLRVQNDVYISGNSSMYLWVKNTWVCAFSLGNSTTTSAHTLTPSHFLSAPRSPTFTHLPGFRLSPFAFNEYTEFAFQNIKTYFTIVHVTVVLPFVFASQSDGYKIGEKKERKKVDKQKIELEREYMDGCVCVWIHGWFKEVKNLKLWICIHILQSGQQFLRKFSRVFVWNSMDLWHTHLQFRTKFTKYAEKYARVWNWDGNWRKIWLPWLQYTVKEKTRLFETTIPSFQFENGISTKMK